MKDKYPAFKYQIQSNRECVVQLVLLISEIFHSHKKIWSQNNQVSNAEGFFFSLFF